MSNSNFQNQQAYQQLLQGMNTMQMRAGLMPGMQGQLPPPIVPPQMGMRPADVSSQLQVQFVQQQQMMQMVAPPIMGGGVTPNRRPSPFDNAMMLFPPQLPGPQFGMGRSMARQGIRARTNEDYGEMQAGLGIGMRALGTGGSMLAGGMIGGTMMGPGGALLGAAVGGAAFEHFGMGQSLQNFGSSLMNPMIRHRQQALQLQSQSMNFVRGGSDMSMSGMGLSMNASTQLASQLNSMAGSNQFQRDTGGKFNRQDVMKITRLAGEMGMLDQSHTADQIKDSIGKISRSLANFMKIAEEPDVQEAMRMMGQMRTLGMSVGQTSMAATNARMFARMAGTDVRGVMAGGMQGAGMFQQVGLTGAAGLNAGMAAQGMAGQLAGLLDPRRLALAGGQQGIASNLMAGAANAGTMDALLPTMLTRRGGRLAIDQEQIMRMANGEINIQEAMQQGSRNITRLGGRSALQELSTRRRELQDEAQQGMGGMMANLMPLIHARAIMQSTPGMNMGGALRMTGMSEQQARTYEQMAQSPEFWQNLRQQQMASLREERTDLAQRRAEVREAASSFDTTRRLRSSWEGQGRRLSNLTGAVSGIISRRDDLAEEQEAQGGGRIIGAVAPSELDSGVQRAAARDLTRTQEGRARLASIVRRAGAGIDADVAAEHRVDENIQRLRSPVLGSTGIIGAEVGEWGFQELRGYESQRSIVNRNSGLGTRIARTVGLERPTNARIAQEAQSMLAVGRRFERAAQLNTEQRQTTLSTAQQALGRTLKSPEDFNRALGEAAAAINSHADDATGLVIDTPITEESQRQAVRDRLHAAGYSVDQINEIVNNREFMLGATAEGAGSRSPRAQAAIDAAVERESEVDTGRRLQRTAIARARADGQRSQALERVGISAGFWSSTSRDQQRAVLNVLAGAGPEHDLRRQLVAVNALEARARALGDGDEADSLRAQAVRLRREATAGKTPEQVDAAQRAIEGANIDESTFSEMGENLSGQDNDQLRARFGASGAQATDAQGEGIRAELANRVGARGAEILTGEGGIDAFQRYLESGGDGELSDSEREQLLAGIRGRTITADSLNADAARAHSGEGDVGIAGGLASLTERAVKGEFGSVISSLQEWATGEGGEAPSTATTGPRQPETFAEAVGMFSEASDKLLQAANQLSTGGTLTGLGQQLYAASPLAPLARLFGGGNE